LAAREVLVQTAHGAVEDRVDAGIKVRFGGVLSSSTVADGDLCTWHRHHHVDLERPAVVLVTMRRGEHHVAADERPAMQAQLPGTAPNVRLQRRAPSDSAIGDSNRKIHEVCSLSDQYRSCFVMCQLFVAIRP